ncbi:MAG: transporter substrate-binding domain-containing protein [Pseudomonadota bacterium]
MLAMMALLLVATLQCAAAATLRLLVQSQTAPYLFNDAGGAFHGIAIDILDAAATRMGVNFEYHETSMARLLADAKQRADIDGAAPVKGDDGDGLYYSAPVFGFENVVLTRAVSKIAVNRLADIDRYNFAIWQNGWRSLGPEFEAKYRPDGAGHFRANYHEHSSHETVVKVFWLGRVDVVVLDRYVFNWYTKQLAGSVDTSAKLTVHPIFSEKSMYKVAFRDPGLRKRFNAALKAMNDDGSIDAIMRKY